MSKKLSFTQSRIKNLPTPDEGRVDYSDTDIKKLVCRVSSTGNKSFLLTKRVSGKLRNVTIGKFPDVSVTEAKKKAQFILTELNSGIDPTAQKKKQKIEQIPLGDVLEMYLSGRDLKPLTVRGYRYKLKHGFNDWLTKPINRITEDMVLKRHKEISKIGKTTANTTMRVLRLTLNYAKAVGMIDSAPTDILSNARLWHKDRRKIRMIPSNKLQEWHKAVESLSNQRAKVYLFMALYMGFRSNELLTLKWSYVDITNKSISLSETKNGTSHTLPIPNALMPYLAELKELTGGSEWAFEGHRAGSPMVAPMKSIKVVTQSTGVEFSPHDCRRTFATIAEAVNLPITMIKRLMNHVSTNDVTGGYIVTEEETLRKAINKVADYIQVRAITMGELQL